MTRATKPALLKPLVSYSDQEFFSNDAIKWILLLKILNLCVSDLACEHKAIAYANAYETGHQSFLCAGNGNQMEAILGDADGAQPVGLLIVQSV